jgi:hypothetical protein
VEAPASSAAACAAFSAAAVACFCATGSGGPAFCIAGFGRDLARRRASSTAGSMGRESAGRKGASGRGVRPLFQGRKRIAMQISAAAIKNSRTDLRRAVELSRENVMRESSRCNLAVVKPGGSEGRDCSTADSTTQAVQR